MNAKKRIFLIALVAVALAAQFFTSFKNKEPATQPNEQTKVAESPQASPSQPSVQVAKRPAKANTNPQPELESLGNYDVQMKNDRLKQKLVPTDYYMLALSWSPAFCQSQKQSNGKYPSHLKYQCDGSQQFGWVIHGLWPQNANGVRAEDHPRYCQGDLPMVEENIIRQYLPESPGAMLLQGEWEKHGACAFTRAEEYFAKQKQLFQALRLPNFATPKSELFKWLREHNPQLNGVYIGSRKDEIYICYNTQWQPMDCPR